MLGQKSVGHEATQSIRGFYLDARRALIVTFRKTLATAFATRIESEELRRESAPTSLTLWVTIKARKAEYSSEQMPRQKNSRKNLTDRIITYGLGEPRNRVSEPLVHECKVFHKSPEVRGKQNEEGNPYHVTQEWFYAG
jgi:hypothetical protein